MSSHVPQKGKGGIVWSQIVCSQIVWSAAPLMVLRDLLSISNPISFPMLKKLICPSLAKSKINVVCLPKA